jgi:uncharacterized protein (TIGR00251 family)
MPIEISSLGHTVRFQVRVQPRASRDEVAGEWNGMLKLRLSAPPVEGKANAACCRLLARSLKVPLQSVKILVGERTSIKLVEINGVTPQQVLALLQVCA